MISGICLVTPKKTEAAIKLLKKVKQKKLCLCGEFYFQLITKTKRKLKYKFLHRKQQSKLRTAKQYFEVCWF